MRKVLVLPDIHRPVHDKYAVKEAGKFAKAYKPDYLVQLGDYYDLEAVTGHDKDPARPHRLIDELRQGDADFTQLWGSLPSYCKKYITLGNHEDRLQRYVWRKASALDGLADIGAFLRLREQGFSVVPYRRTLKLGKVYFTHDLGRAGAGCALHATRLMQANVIFGHSHRLEVAYETNGKGVPHFGCTAGWLGDPNKIVYSPREYVRRQWVQGWVTLDMAADGTAKLQQHPLF